MIWTQLKEWKVRREEPKGNDKEGKREKYRKNPCVVDAGVKKSTQVRKPR